MEVNLMEKIKSYIKTNTDKTMTNEEIVKLKDIIKEKYNVILPNDYCEFLKLSNGFNFYSDGICNNEEIIELTDELKELISDWDTNLTQNFENYIVIGNIYEHGYTVYLNESKKYVLIEDLFMDFSLDGNDKNLLYFSSIWEIFIYFDCNCGNKIFKEDYDRIFEKQIKKDEELHNNIIDANKKAIEKLHDDVKANNAVEFEININNDYLKALENEYARDIQILKMTSYATIHYNDGNSFNLNINFVNNRIDIINSNKVASLMYPSIDFSIETFSDRQKYYVLRVKDRAVEPIIIFKDNLSKKIINQLEKKYLSKNAPFFKRLFNKF